MICKETLIFDKINIKKWYKAVADFDYFLQGKVNQLINQFLTLYQL